jgi:hypothetical protein
MKKLITVLFLSILLNGCADVQPQVKEVVTGHEYGFWGGLWHGIVSPISIFGKIFTNDIDVYAINNNGGWYAFGFVLGAGILLGGSSASSKK